MNREKTKQKRMMHFFYALFDIVLVFHCALPLLAIIIFWTSLERFSAFLWGIVFFYFGFLGILVSLIFLFLARRSEEKYLGPEDNPAILKKVQKSQRMVLGCVGAIALAGIGTYTGLRTHYYLETVIFTREKWLAGGQSERWHMLNSFIRQHHPLSLNKEQVDYYLGTPDVEEEREYIYYVRDYVHAYYPYSFTLTFGMTYDVISWSCQTGIFSPT